MNIVLPAQVKIALGELEKNGFDAYVVGGCVRDSILMKAPPDWDITTNALPKDINEVFKEYKTVDTGIKHGTVTVIIDSMPLEITTFRVDGDYLDNRHPDSVSFRSNIEDDLSRRDFTVNSLAFNEKCGIVDLFGGIDDIKRKIIKCVGNPDLRFNEDALRILRALRFSSVLGFELERLTSDSVIKNAYLLQSVSKERIQDELLKLICGKNVVNVLLKYRDVFAKIIPEIEPMFDFNQNNKHHVFDVWKHTVYAIGFSDPDPVVRMALLLHDIGKPHSYTVDSHGVGHFYGHGKLSAEISEIVLRNLKFSNEMAKTILTLVEHHDISITPNERIVKRRLANFTLPILKLLLRVQTADSLAHNPIYAGYTEEIKEIGRIVDKVIADEQCFSLSSLAIDGNDLINVGIEEGKSIGKILNALLVDVIEENTPNNKEALITRAKEILGGIKYEQDKD